MNQSQKSYVPLIRRGVIGIIGAAAVVAVPSSALAATSGVTQAKASVAQLMKQTTSFKAPGSSLTVKSLKKKTIWYIPITLEDPEFAIVSQALKTVTSQSGMNLQVCNGQSNPSDVAACLTRAKNSKASGIITDSIPVVMSADAFQAAESAKIPIEIADQLPPPASANLPGTVKGVGNDSLSYLTGNGPALVAQAADWITADSGGNANVLLAQFTDSYSTQAYAATGLKRLKALCPACQTTVQDVSSSSFQLIPGQISSALLKSPDTNYVLSEFDAGLQPVYGGVQQAGASAKVKGVSTTGVLGALQMIKSKTYLAADMGTDFPYQGYAEADQLFRMMLKKPIVKETIPSRLFTAANINGLALTAAGQGSGSWYGSLTWKTMFTGLWGI